MNDVILQAQGLTKEFRGFMAGTHRVQGRDITGSTSRPPAWPTKTSAAAPR